MCVKNKQPQMSRVDFHQPEIGLRSQAIKTIKIVVAA